MATFAVVVQESLADGYEGVRVAADNSALAADPEAFRRWLEWEHLADQFLLQHPVTGLCAFDTRRLSSEVIADLAALHPVLVDAADSPPFRVFGDGDGGDGLAVIGECDTFVADQLYRLLDAAPRHGDLILDLSATTFLNHRALLALSRLADGADEGRTRVTLRHPPATAVRVWDLIGQPSASLHFEGGKDLVQSA